MIITITPKQEFNKALQPKISKYVDSTFNKDSRLYTTLNTILNSELILAYFTVTIQNYYSNKVFDPISYTDISNYIYDNCNNHAIITITQPIIS